jgi:DnaJ-class molecular chaperone
MSKRDYYEVLGIDKGAAPEEIKKAFRTKAKQLHPDRNSDNPNAEGQFKEANEAYDILKDGEKKAAPQCSPKFKAVQGANSLAARRYPPIQKCYPTDPLSELVLGVH